MIVRGERVNLRKLKKADAPSISREANDPQVARFLTLPHPYRLEHALAFIRTTHKGIRMKTSIEMGIEDKATGSIIGMMSLVSFDRENNSAEMGYWLGRRHWGRGLAAEAARLLLHFGFDIMDLHRICARVAHHNRRSARLLERIGMRYEGRFIQSICRNGQRMDELRYAMLKGEYESSVKAGNRSVVVSDRSSPGRNRLVDNRRKSRLHNPV